MKLKHGVTVITTAMEMAVAGSAAAEQTAPIAQGEPPEIEPAPIPQTTPAIPETTPLGTPLYTPDTGAPPAPPPRWEPASSFGMAILAGGGVTDYTDSSTRSETGTGGSWDVRFAVATRRWVGFEGSYIGGANTISGLGLTNSNNTARLIRNGLEGALRINAPLYSNNTLLEPYVLGGVGWNGYRVSNVNSVTQTASISTQSDNTVSVPLGVGFAIGHKGFMADLRYTIRPTYQQTIFTGQGSSALTNWDAGGMLGYEF